MKTKVSKKGQAWSLDLVSGLAIFLVGIMIFFTYSLNQPTQAKETLELGRDYNQPFKKGILQNSLKKLQLGVKYNHPFKKGILPESLEKLYCYNNNITILQYKG